MKPLVVEPSAVAMYDTDAVKELVGTAIQAAPRGTQTWLGKACGVKPQIVQRWANKMHAPDVKYWGEIERYFDWKPGTIAEAGGAQVVRRTLVLEGTGIEIEIPPGHDAEEGDVRYVLMRATPDDPVFAQLLELAQRTVRTEERLALVESFLADLRQGTLAEGSVEGSDATVHVLKPKADRLAADTGTQTPRKGPRRRSAPPADQDDA